MLLLKERAWEEFGNEEGRSSLQETGSRSDDIITPPATLPGYQYRKVTPFNTLLVLYGSLSFVTWLS